MGMGRWHIKPWGVLAGVLLMAGALAAQVNYDVDPKNSTDGTPVPDVDKAHVVQGLPPPFPADLGCWAAAASNVLGAAGWGTGANAQAKANNIYQDLINQFGPAGLGYIDALGDAPAGAKWWVHNIGLDAADAGAGYTPECTYVNFRVKEMTLYEVDANFLLDELARCQYVTVKWMIPEEGGHCVTMVGGNYGPNDPKFTNAPQQSVWHDSDSDPLIGNDEVRPNLWGPNTEWYLQMPRGNWIADGFMTVCPGVPKPASAIGNFDIHYYVGIGNRNDPPIGDPYYDTTVQMTFTGSNYGAYHFDDGSTDPYWDSAANGPTLVIPNEEIDDLFKKLYISVDFNDPALVPVDATGKPTVPDIDVFDDDDNEIALDSAAWASDNGQVLLTYIFDDQPAWEKVVFPSDEYVLINRVGQQGYNVFEWNIATECVPEPATLALLVLGGAAALVRRRR